MPSEFEQKYLRSLKYWVNSIVIDALNLKVEIELITNPESQSINAKLRFIEVIEYQGSYYEYDNCSKFDSNYLPFLVGILSVNTEKGINYIITTDTTEVSLITKKQPEIFRFD